MPDGRERVYLDANATVAALPAAVEAYRVASAQAANPASHHAGGVAATRDLTDARLRVAAVFGCHVDEVIFTSGATEANTMALYQPPPSVSGGEGVPLIVSSDIEHPSVNATMDTLAQRGACVVRRCRAPASGRVEVAELIALLPEPDDATISSVCLTLMAASNETGVLQDVRGLRGAVEDWSSRIGGKKPVTLHCDAVQVIGRLTSGAPAPWPSSDRMSISGHKIGAMPGIGALLVRTGDHPPLHRHTAGGGQEQGRRPGTENVAGAVSLAAALEHQADDEELAWLELQRDTLEGSIVGQLGAAALVVGGGTVADCCPLRLPQTSLIRFLGCRGEAMMAALDVRGISCSTGSACSSGASEPSPTLLAMGYSSAEAEEAVRFSLPRIPAGPARLEFADKLTWLAGQVVDVARRARGIT